MTVLPYIAAGLFVMAVFGLYIIIRRIADALNENRGWGDW